MFCFYFCQKLEFQIKIFPFLCHFLKDLKRPQKSSKDLKRPQNHTVIKYKLYLSRSPLETERWWSVPESPPSDNDPSSSGSTDPALGLLRDLREPPLSIWDAKDGTLFLRWRLPIELCSDTARFA